jgi:hypothetical protein
MSDLPLAPHLTGLAGGFSNSVSEMRCRHARHPQSGRRVSLSDCPRISVFHVARPSHPFAALFYHYLEERGKREQGTGDAVTRGDDGGDGCDGHDGARRGTMGAAHPVGAEQLPHKIEHIPIKQCHRVDERASFNGRNCSALTTPMPMGTTNCDRAMDFVEASPLRRQRAIRAMVDV